MARASTRTQTPEDVTGPTSLPRNTRRGRSEPGALIVIGFMILALWFFMTTLQIQTTEAKINNTQSVNDILNPQWSVWLQLPKLFFGSHIPGPALDANAAISIVMAWIIEIVFLALVAAFEVAIIMSRRLGRFLGFIFRVVMWIIIVFNGLADASYGNVSIEVHIGFAVLAAAVVGFGLHWGLALIETGWKKL